MNSFLATVMRGPWQATLSVAVLAVLPFMLMRLGLVVPPLHVLITTLGAALLGLVALRRGGIEALQVAGGGLLAAVLVTWAMYGTVEGALVLAGVLWVPTLALAVLVRQRVALSPALSWAAIGGALVVVAFFAWQPNPTAWWRETLSKMMEAALSRGAGPETDEMRDMVTLLASQMTGIVAAAEVVSVLAALFVARWWQARLYNPGGFAQEFRALRVGRPLAAALLGLLTLALVMPNALLVKNLMVVGIVVFAIQGLSVIHAWSAAGKQNVLWLLALYSLMIFILPVAMFALAVVGLMDSWLDFRARRGANPPSS